MTTTETTVPAKREYKLAADATLTNYGQHRRDIIELEHGNRTVIVNVANDDAVDVLEALRRAYQAGREGTEEYAPNPLDDRILAMTAILRESGNEDDADETEVAAAFVREAWCGGSSGGDIPEALETIEAYASELLKMVRAHPAEAREAETAGEQS